MTDFQGTQAVVIALLLIGPTLTVGLIAGAARVVAMSGMWVRPPGRCRRCGYDLRATPGRCPECGTPTA